MCLTRMERHQGIWLLHVMTRQKLQKGTELYTYCTLSDPKGTISYLLVSKGQRTIGHHSLYAKIMVCISVYILVLSQMIIQYKCIGFKS